MSDHGPMRPDQPSPRGALLRYLPALDGLRAVALGAVLLDHSGLDIAPGGFLGVTTFFVLSGFLIAALLLRERDVTGSIDLRAFWVRRARRLVPAALLFVGVAAAYLLFGSSRPPEGVFGDGVATLGWVANWRFVFEGRSYGDLFSEPTPFQHVWSLAVEEQFYVGLPLVAVALLGLRGAARRGRFAIGVCAVIGLSTAAAWLLHDPGSPPVRAYYGTDARVAELAVGVLLAVVLVPRSGLRRLNDSHRRVATAVATAGAVLLLGLVATLEPGDTFLYRGGFLLAALASAAVVTAATQPGPVNAVLRWRPLVSAGRVTYGAYLFHWPIFLWLTEASTGLAPIPLLLVRGAATFGLAGLSFRLLEQPIRKGSYDWSIGGLSWAAGSIGVLAVLFAVTSTVPAPVSSLIATGSSDEGLVAPPPRASSTSSTTAPPSPSTTASVRSSPAGPASAPTTTPPAATAGRPRPPSRPSNAGIPTGPTAPPPPPPTTVPAAAAEPVRIAVIGDSLAQNLVGGMTKWAEGRDDAVVYGVTLMGCPISRGGTRRIANDGDFPVRSGCGWWNDPDSEAYGYLMDFEPDVVIVHDAINEIPDRYRAAWDGYRRLGDPVLDSWLDDEYAAFFDTAAKWGAERVLMLDAPCIDWAGSPPWDEVEDGEGRRKMLNDHYASYADDRVEIGDFDAQICPDGKFTTTVMGVEDARPDGIHLTEAASLEVAKRWLGPLAIQGRR